MKHTIDRAVLQKHGLSIADFAILLYMISTNKSSFDETELEALWNQNYLIKEVSGYSINRKAFEKLEVIIAESSIAISTDKRAESLAPQLRELFPEGKKAGTNYYWRDSNKIIAQKLKMFFKKFGEDYTDEQIINATRSYVESFGGAHTYMHLLKYFISKKNLQNGEETSELLSFIENNDSGVTNNSNWTDELK